MDQGEEGQLAVFVSEDSRVLEEIIDQVDVVVSDRSDLEGLAPDKFHDLSHDEDEILELLKSKGVSTAVCLRYRRLFSGSFLEQVKCEMYNLHPSILPAFKGLEVYERVIDRGVKISGATLHRVSEEMDEGEIIDQVSYRVPEDVSVKELKRYAAKYEVQIVRTNLEKL
jgi:folate-dependent phosphoribosylglycinamide formyltransferase PurN